MKVNYAQYQQLSTYLSNTFGKELACRKLNCSEEELAEKVGIIQKGKRKGLLKGKITWIKCTKGGWIKTGRYDDEQMRAKGFVLRKGSFNYAIIDSWTGELIQQITEEYPYFSRGNCTHVY